jgi:F-type H+-transporting ATPase subunit delta
MDLIHVAKVYSSALLEIAVSKKSEDTFETELKLVVNSIKDDKSIWIFLISPIVKKEEKIKVLEKGFAGKISESIHSLLYILIKNDRIEFIDEIYEQYILGLDKLKGRIRARIESATELTESQKKEIQATLSSNFNGECIIQNVVKPELIGGLIIYFNDKLIDGSMRTSLFNLKQNLLQSKLSGAYYEN